MSMDQRGLLGRDLEDIIVKDAIIHHFDKMVPGLSIIERAENLDAKHMLGLLHDNVTSTFGRPPSSATASSPWWRRCLAWASRLPFPSWLPCLAPARTLPQLQRIVQCSASPPALELAGITIMAGRESEYDGALDSDLVSDQSLKLQDQSTHLTTTVNAAAGGLEITCFSELVDDATFHFQIIRFPKQIYAWIGCNSTKFGDLYAAASTRPSNTVGVASILGGSSDNTGSGIARRLVLKTGLNVILACSIPKNSPMLEANAEKKLMEKLVSLGYTQPR
ncbi:hypothetical protein SLE2022_093170 [Rubroshorea leprosula]